MTIFEVKAELRRADRPRYYRLEDDLGDEVIVRPCNLDGVPQPFAFSQLARRADFNEIQTSNG